MSKYTVWVNADILLTIKLVGTTYMRIVFTLEMVKTNQEGA